MPYQSIRELANNLRTGQYSSEELTRHFLKRIANINPTLNAFISTTEEIALKQATDADKLLRSNESSNLLLGIPIAHKDIFCTNGVKTSCGSRMLDNFISPYDATVVEKLNRAGAVMLGKTNMDEFAMGSSNETSWYGAVQNPWDLTKVPGGSSGGSAAAVAAGLCIAATGTDTGGSIRQPASLCGITGLKPTYGRVSRFGMIAFASSLDQGGTLTRSVEDAAIMLQVMAGFDPKDSTSVEHPVPNYLDSLDADISGLRIGLPKEYFAANLDSSIADSVTAAIAEYQKLGAKVQDISLPHSNLVVPTYYVVAPAECSSNLARYDGVRFGHRCENPQDLMDLYQRSRSEGFGPEVKRRIMIGTYVLSAGYYDAYYLKAQQVRQLIAKDFEEAFAEVDVIMTPTSPTTAFRIGERMTDQVAMYLSDLYTIAAPLTGLPALSIPTSLVNGLPSGLQIMAKHFEEAKLLNVAHKLQQVTDWHTKMPPKSVIDM
ncbi:glutamyl-tRNA amidotransferase [Achromatium sp. WMS3]|nr:glutamyl-tRNA amidotransferase [Achromatium sp. WMS3]